MYSLAENENNKSSEWEVSAYAAYSKNDEIRLSSSSGGLFTELASRIIETGGVVFGAMFDDAHSVMHGFAQTEIELKKLSGSKYVYSKIGDSYRTAKEFLECGKTVYFSGTPCQIAGLKKYLKKDYWNLVTQDVVCHGTPSPVIWRSYLKYLQEKYNSNIKKIYFRDKTTGWKTYSITIEFENQKKYTQRASENLYMRGFLKNIYLKEACYRCQFKKQNFFSDITLGDFWGIENIVPALSDEKGVSLVLLRTEKGSMLLQDIADKLTLQKVNYCDALNYNGALVKPPQKHARRDAFFSEYKNGEISNRDFEKLLGKYCNDGFYNNLKKAIKKFLK